MATTLVTTIKTHFTDEPTDRLRDIWITNDRNTYSDDAFTAIRELLTERGIEVPAQNAPLPPPPAAPRGSELVVSGILRAFFGFILLSLLMHLMPARKLSLAAYWLIPAFMVLSIVMILWGFKLIIIGIIRKK